MQMRAKVDKALGAVALRLPSLLEPPALPGEILM